MPLIEVHVIENVFNAEQKRQMISKLTDAMVSIEGESMRGVTWVKISEVASGNFAGAPAPSHQPLPRGCHRAPRASCRARSPAQARRSPAPGSRDNPLRDREQARRIGTDARPNAAARLALTGGCGVAAYCRYIGRSYQSDPLVTRVVTAARRVRGRANF